MRCRSSFEITCTHRGFFFGGFFFFKILNMYVDILYRTIFFYLLYNILDTYMKFERKITSRYLKHLDKCIVILNFVSCFNRHQIRSFIILVETSVNSV
jgi:hypothetical protein